MKDNGRTKSVDSVGAKLFRTESEQRTVDSTQLLGVLSEITMEL